MSAADLIGGAENLGDSGEVGWEELVSEAPPTTLSLGESEGGKTTILGVIRYQLSYNYCYSINVLHGQASVALQLHN